MLGVMLLGALSDGFHSWIFCWVLEVMLLGASDVLFVSYTPNKNNFQSWILCWVLEVMLLGALDDLFASYRPNEMNFQS